MSQAREYLRQFHGSPTRTLRRVSTRIKTSQFLRRTFTRAGRRQRRERHEYLLHGQFEEESASSDNHTLTRYSQALLWSRPSSESPADSSALGVQANPSRPLVPPPSIRAPALPPSIAEDSLVKKTPSLNNPKGSDALMSGAFNHDEDSNPQGGKTVNGNQHLHPLSALQASAASSRTSFKSAVSSLHLDTAMNGSQATISYHPENIQKSVFYCCSLEYTQRTTIATNGRAPLFVTSQSPKKVIDRPCTADECPIAGAHASGRYLYRDQTVPEFLMEELDREFGEGARRLWGESNPHPLIWDAFWLSALNRATRPDILVVEDFMRCHGRSADAIGSQGLDRALEVLKSGTPSPCSSTVSE